MVINSSSSGGGEGNTYTIQDNAHQQQEFPSSAQAGEIVKSTTDMIILGVIITGEQSQEEIPFDYFDQGMDKGYIFVMPQENVIITNYQ